MAHRLRLAYEKLFRGMLGGYGGQYRHAMLVGLVYSYIPVHKALPGQWKRSDRTGTRSS